MKKKLLAGLLLATLAIGVLSPTSSEAAAKKVSTTTKANAVFEEKYYEKDKLYRDGVVPIQKRSYGKNYKDKTVDYGDDSTEPYTDRDIYKLKPYHRYNYENVHKSLDIGFPWDAVITLGLWEGEVAQGEVSLSCFKTTKAKLTDDEIIIKGTYTFSVKKIQGKDNFFPKKKYMKGYRLDRDFFKRPRKFNLRYTKV